MKKFLICLVAMALVLCMVLPLASCTDPAEPEGSETESNETPVESGDNKPSESEQKPAESTPESQPAEDTDDTDESETEGTETTGSEASESETETETETEETYLPIPNGNGYTWKDAVTVLSTNWNQHTYQTTDESYPVGYLTTGLYGFFFNDEEIYKSSNGADPYAGYVIAPEMAAKLPVDVTAEVKALEGNPFNIPEGATEGYAYKIELNQAAKWQNGVAINADTYVYSMAQLLDPDLMNYRGPDYFDGDFAIANAKNYYYQGTTNYNDNGTNNGYVLADLVKGENGNYYTKDGNAMFVAVDYPISWLGGATLQMYVEAYGAESFGLEKWDELAELAAENDGRAPLNDSTYAALLATITTNPAWGETEADAFNYFLEEVVYADDYAFSNVGLYKSGEY